MPILLLFCASLGLACRRAPRDIAADDAAADDAASDARMDAPPPHAKAPTVKDWRGPLVREQRSVVVDGVGESWRLEWKNPPTSWQTAWGYQWFGEQGALELVRARVGEPDDRLDLTPLYSYGATLQRWVDHDREAGWDVVEHLPLEQMMVLGDYDHDGRITELVLPLREAMGGMYYEPPQTVLVGLDRHQARLHALGTAEHPATPLVLSKAGGSFGGPADWAWLLTATGPVEAELSNSCSDDSAEARPLVITWYVRFDAAGLHVTERTYDCAGTKRGALKRAVVL